MQGRQGTGHRYHDGRALCNTRCAMSSNPTYPNSHNCHRAHLPRSLGDVHVPAQSKIVSRPRTAAFECCSASPHSGRLAASATLPPGPPWPNDLLLSNTNPCYVSFGDRLRQRSCVRAVRSEVFSGCGVERREETCDGQEERRCRGEL
jgi:hypothetical protein